MSLEQLCQACGSRRKMVLSQNACMNIVKSQTHESSKRVLESMKFREDLHEDASQTSTHEDAEGIDESMETNSFRSPMISRQSTLSRPSSIDECSPITQYLQCGPSPMSPPAHLGGLTTCDHPVSSLSCVSEVVEQNRKNPVTKYVFKEDSCPKVEAVDLASSQVDVVASSFSNARANSTLPKIGFSRKDELMQRSGYVLPIVVRNTFITVEDCSPSLIALRKKQRSSTLPACAPMTHFLEEAELDACPLGGYDGDSRSFEANGMDESVDSLNRDGNPALHAEMMYSNSCIETRNLAADRHNVKCTEEVPGQSSASGSLESVEGSPSLNFACSSALSMNKVKMAASQNCLVWTPGSEAFQFRVCWTVNSQKVRGNEKQTVSPHFELPLGPAGELIKLRLAVYPKTADPKSAVNFKSSKGKGYVQIKCDSDGHCAMAPVQFTIAVGGGHRAQGIRGPVEHDFAKNSIAGLPRHYECWDFKVATESRSMTFPVLLEIARVSDGAKSSRSS